MKLPLILDGATGTMLQSAGLPQGVCPELWILEHPEVLSAIQRKYVKAGSNIVYAPTFGANRVKLAGFSDGSKTAEINRELVRLSQNAVGKDALVAGDMAPCGRFIAPFGDSDMDELIDIYFEQAGALEDAGVSLFVIETSMTIAEARAAVIAIRKCSDKPVFVTFTCDAAGRTLSGADILSALIIFQAMGVSAFGLNCSAGPDEMLKNIERLTPYARVPLIAKPNAGLPEMCCGQTVYSLSAVDFTENTRALYDAGVRIFGGCCGTTEEHIAALSKEVSRLPVEPFKNDSPEAKAVYLATERTILALNDAQFSKEELPCSPMLCDDFMDYDEECPRVRITSAEDAQVLEESQHTARMPVCIACDDSIALSSALKSYNGRAAVVSKLEPAILRPICDRYGAVIL